jgi:hypothetical protein
MIESSESRPTSSRWTLVVLLLFPALLVASSCTTTKLEGSWISPKFRNQRLAGRVIVVGVARDETVRRVYEDVMAAGLAARGVEAVRSYEITPQAIDHKTGDAIFAAARGQGARYILSTAVLARGKKTVVHEELGPYVGLASYRGWYGTYWAATFPARTTVREYDVYSAETSITDVASDRLQWTARTKSTPRGNIEQDVREFVAVLLDAMTTAGVL